MQFVYVYVSYVLVFAIFGIKWLAISDLSFCNADMGNYAISGTVVM